MNIYTAQYLYPYYDISIKEHYKSLKYSVFITFLPFFKISNKQYQETNYQKSQQISLEEARAKNENYNRIQATNAIIYSYDNKNYPKDEEILKQGQIVTWDFIRINAGFKSYSEIYKALKTSIGAYNKAHVRDDLNKKLKTFVAKEQIWVPAEGAFDVITLTQIYHSFIHFNKFNIIVQDEFYHQTKELNLENLSMSDFINAIGGKDYYIYASDKSLLFTIEWDSFFFLICSDSNLLPDVISHASLEGFYANNSTTHAWEFEDN